MPPVRYLFPRLVRHFLPEAAVRFLLHNRFIIRPGLETRSPDEAVQRYQAALNVQDIPLAGKRVLLFGYGGSFAVGCSLLELGAAHVILSERADFVTDPRNRQLLSAYPHYLEERRPGQVYPRSQFFTLLHGDIRTAAAQQAVPPADLILSSSVFEHLADVPGITRALARLTRPDGAQLHFIDLRDHFFRYPFEMLTVSQSAWHNWLNPTSNLNRFRTRDYRQVFEDCFQSVALDVLERDPTAFEAARARIRPEFLSGDREQDSVTILRVTARRPTQE